MQNSADVAMATSIVVLAADTIWTNAVVRALRERFGRVPLILEEKESVWVMLRRRRRRLGAVTVIGQKSGLQQRQGLPGR